MNNTEKWECIKKEFRLFHEMSKALTAKAPGSGLHETYFSTCLGGGGGKWGGSLEANRSILGLIPNQLITSTERDL